MKGRDRLPPWARTTATEVRLSETAWRELERLKEATGLKKSQVVDLALRTADVSEMAEERARDVEAYKAWRRSTK